MPRKRRSSSPFELYDDDLDEDASSQGSHNANMPVQRNAANARERARMRVLSSAFGRLKTKLPNIPADTKLSKLDTLRLATMYIKQLKTAVEGTSTSSSGGNSMEHFDAANLMNEHLNWPFGFHNTQNATRHVAFNAHTNTNAHSTPSDWTQHTSQQIYAKQARYEHAQSTQPSAVTFHEQRQQQQQQQQQAPNQTAHQQQHQWYSSIINYELSQQQQQHHHQPSSCSYVVKQQQQQQHHQNNNNNNNNSTNNNNGHMEHIHHTNLSINTQLHDAHPHTHIHLPNITQTTLHSQ